MNDEPKVRLLVVDDEVDNLDTFRRVFRKEFVISCASSGAEALALLRRQPFDLAFVDHAMADVSGVELLRLAARIQPAMVRLMITAHDGLAVVREARAEGVVAAVIPKPWQREQVLRAVATFQSLARMRASVERLRDRSG
ncbi:MAG TPA: response regulator [Polyangiaceae bacterium]|nr:response regulator [Polyangiaceae bacterium]